MNYRDFDYLAFCDETSKTDIDGITYFGFCSILMTPDRYEAVRKNVTSAALDTLKHEGEFKAQAIGYGGKRVLNAAFRQKDRTSLSCTVDFGELGIERIFYLATALGAEFSDQYHGTATADFHRYMAWKIKDSLPPDRLKQIYKGIHAFKPKDIFAAFRSLAQAWKHFELGTTLGSLSRSIEQTFDEGKEENFLKFGDKSGGFYGAWGHQMLQGLISQFETQERWAGKRIWVIHDALDKAESIYDNAGFPVDLSRVTLNFVNSKDELGVQLADLTAWIAANSHFDKNVDHQVWLAKRFARKFSTSTLDFKAIEDFDLSGVRKK